MPLVRDYSDTSYFLKKSKDKAGFTKEMKLNDCAMNYNFRFCSKIKTSHFLKKIDQINSVRKAYNYI